MANTFAPFGFRQYSGNGSAPTYEQVEMQIASNYTTPIFYGDAVLQDANGTITRAGDAPTTQLAGVFRVVNIFQSPRSALFGQTIGQVQTTMALSMPTS